MNDAPLDHALLLQWAFGAVVVVIYARDRFDKPESARSTTTRARYWSARVGYIVSMLLLFLMLGGAVTDLDFRWLWDFLQVQAVLKDSERLPGPLLSALVLTSMLPHMEFLSRIDEAVKQWFKRIGNIPGEVRRLSDWLQNQEFFPTEAALQRVTPTLLDMGVDPAWLQDRSNIVRRNWARTVTLWALIDNWNSSRSYSRFLQQQKTRFDEVQQRLVKQSEELNEPRYWEAGEPLGAHASLQPKGLRTQVNELYKAVCDFVSGGVLNCEWRLAERNMAFASLGFKIAPGGGSGRLSIHELSLVSLAICLVMTLIALISRRFFDPTPLAPYMRILVMVPLIYAVAISAAIYPKAWKFADIRRVGHRPVAAYALSGVVAAGAAFVIALLFRFLFEGQGNLLFALSEPGRFTRAITITMERWPWQLMTMLNTFAIAWWTDNSVLATAKESRWLRVREAVSLAICFCVIQWMALELLAVFTSEGNSWFDRAHTLLATSSAVGACIGYFVPHFYRKKLREIEGPPRLPTGLATA